MFEHRSVDHRSIAVPYTPARIKVIFIAMVFICDTIDFTGIVTSLLTQTIAGAGAFYWLRVKSMHGMSASIQVLFSAIFLMILYSVL